MGIGAWWAATQAKRPSFYCDTPKAFISGETADLPGHLSLPELANTLNTESILLMQGLLAGKDYVWEKPDSNRTRFGEAAMRLQNTHPELVRQFRWEWRKHCTGRPEGKQKVTQEDVNYVLSEVIPVPNDNRLQPLFEAAVQCGWLTGIWPSMKVNFTGKHTPRDRQDHLRVVLVALDGGFFESHVEHLLGKSALFNGFLRSVQPPGETQAAGFGQTDFLAYCPARLSLALISCKTTPPQLEHLEATLARKERFGGRFAEAWLCMENTGGKNPDDIRKQLKLLNIKGAFAEELPQLLQCQ